MRRSLLHKSESVKRRPKIFGRTLFSRGPLALVPIVYTVLVILPPRTRVLYPIRPSKDTPRAPGASRTAVIIIRYNDPSGQNLSRFHGDRYDLSARPFMYLAFWLVFHRSTGPTYNYMENGRGNPSVTQNAKWFLFACPKTNGPGVDCLRAQDQQVSSIKLEILIPNVRDPRPGPRLSNSWIKHYWKWASCQFPLSTRWGKAIALYRWPLSVF